MDKKLSKDAFKILLQHIKTNKPVDLDFTYDVYDITFESLSNIDTVKLINKAVPLNSLTLFYYIIGEYSYSVENRNEEEIAAFNSSEKIKIQMASVVADKYMASGVLSFQQSAIANKYLPPISSLDVYTNFMVNLLNKLPKNNPNQTLIIDLLNKSASSLRCILKLLCEGYETEAMATWRTLHESECILILLDKYGGPLIDEYLKHMEYGIAYHGGIPSVEKTDEIFAKLKGEMKERLLKSKDMKKFIEYGWLYGTEESKQENFKLNFRDGLETAAGLNRYSKIYEQSSEIVHSTPMLIYSSKLYYYLLTLISTYESFFRIEKIFANYCFKGEFQGIIAQYNTMKNIYFSQLLSIYKNELNRFNHLTK